MQQFKNERKAHPLWFRYKNSEGRTRFAEALWRARCAAALMLVAVLLLPAQDIRAQEPAGQLTMTLATDGSRVEAIRLATDFDVTVSGHVARTRVQQSFRNATDAWAEATYLFPLPDNAAVDHLTLRIGEQLIVGEIQERKQAFETYKAARDSGRKAVLLEQQRSNMFTTGVANIAPGETVVVDIEYQQTLARDGLRYSMRLPLTITPRFTPGNPIASNPDRLGSQWQGATDQVPDGDAITLAQATTVPADSHRFSIQARIDAGVSLASIESRYHPIDVVPEKEGIYQVSLAGNNETLDHDFELTWMLPTSDEAVPALFMSHTDNATYASVQIMPPATRRTAMAPPRSLTLVIDTSGSMQGVSMAQAKSAASFAVNALRDVDRFNVIEFNDTPTQLFGSPQIATPQRRAEAQRWVARLNANGGTQMASALSLALPKSLQDSVALRQVIFVTDGAVGNEDALFGMIEQRLGDGRLFTVGIGSAPNGWFMRKAAEAGRGTYTMISALGEVDERMQRLFKRLAQPVLTDVAVTWNGASMTQYPQTVPDLYAGEPIEFVARSDGEAAPKSVSLQATLWRDGVPEPWQQDIGVSAKSGGDYDAVGVLWARKRIEHLEDARRRRALTPERADKDILAVAMSHHLVSRLTSLVAVDKTPARIAEALRQQRVANLVPYGQRVQSMQAMTSTATPAALKRMSGALMIVLALFGLGFSRRQSLQTQRWSA